MKPTIFSFGDTLRQLRTYQTFTNNNNNIILFTPDKKWNKFFTEQKIIIINEI